MDSYRFSSEGFTVCVLYKTFFSQTLDSEKQTPRTQPFNRKEETPQREQRKLKSWKIKDKERPYIATQIEECINSTLSCLERPFEEETSFPAASRCKTVLANKTANNIENGMIVKS